MLFQFLTQFFALMEAHVYVNATELRERAMYLQDGSKILELVKRIFSTNRDGVSYTVT